MEKTLYEFFGLSRTPFSTISGLEDYFHAASRENLLGHIASKILGGSSIVAIRGGRGIGKTSLMRAFASELSARKLTSVSVTDASLTPANVQRLIGEVGGIRNGESMKPDQLLMTLKGQHGIERLILIFDDAQDLSEAIFRYVSALTAMLCVGTTRVRVVFFGKIGPWPGLGSAELKDLRDATVSQYFVVSLSSREATAYLHHKFRRAGGSLPKLMSKAAVAQITEQADGNPSQLNVITELALNYAYHKRHKRVSSKTVRQISMTHPYQELRLERRFLLAPRAAAIALVVFLAPAVTAWFLKDYVPEPGSNQKFTQGQVKTINEPPQASDPSDRAVSQLPPRRPSTTLMHEPAVAGNGPAAAAHLPSLQGVSPPMALQAAPGPISGSLAAPTPPISIDKDVQAGPPTMGADTDVCATSRESVADFQEHKSDIPLSNGASFSELPTSGTGPVSAVAQPSSPAINSIAPEMAAPRRSAFASIGEPHTIRRGPQPDRSQNDRPDRVPPSNSIRSAWRSGAPGLLLVVGRGDSLATLYTKVYRGLEPPSYEIVVAANRMPISPGSLVIFPEPPNGWLPQ